MPIPSLEDDSRLRVRRKGFFARILEALHRSRRREAIRVLRRYRHLMAGQAQVRPAKAVPESPHIEKSSRNATEIACPCAPTAALAGTPRTGSREVTPLSATPLAIIAALILILHIAASAVLADPLAHASPVASDNDAVCAGDAQPPVPALPFD